MFRVQMLHNDELFYLRSTVWTRDPLRGDLHESADAARAQLVKAKPFMRAASFKAARVVEVGAP